MVYVAKYATSGRAKCRYCQKAIGMGELRLAVMVQSKIHNGFDPHWFHVPCFFLKHRNLPFSTEFEGFPTLKDSDQELLLQYLSGEIAVNSIPNPQNDENGKSGLEGLTNSGEFLVQYAKSNQSHCVTCEGRIKKGEIRISQKDYTSKKALKIPSRAGMDRWHHVDCFVDNRDSLNFFESANCLPGIASLSESDHVMLVARITRVNDPSEFINNRKRQGEEYSGNENQMCSTSTFSTSLSTPIVPTVKWQRDNYSENQTQMGMSSASTFSTSSSAPVAPIISLGERAMLTEQEKLLSSFKTILLNHCNIAETLKELLTVNSQEVPIGTDKMIERAADMLAFGALERCPACKGQFIYKKGSGYHCNGYASEFSKCTKHFKEPPRVAPEIPDELKTNPAFENYVYTPRNRLIIPELGNGCPPPRKIPRIDKLPLHNYKFLISENIQDPQIVANITSKVEQYGGKIVPRIAQNIHAIFSTHDEVRKMTRKMKFAVENNIPVISSDFIHAISEINFDFDVTIRKFLISNWIWFSNKNAVNDKPTTAFRCLSSNMNSFA